MKRKKKCERKNVVRVSQDATKRVPDMRDAKNFSDDDDDDQALCSGARDWRFLASGGNN